MSASNFITLHAIHAMPASLLNRDDAGAAKRITFGGTSRLRVSSQAWKRAIRTSMRSTAIDGGVYGLRTTRFPQLTAQQLADTHGRDLDAATAKSAAVFNALKFKATDKGTTAVAIFATETLPTTVAAAIDAQWDAIGDDVPDDTVAAARAALDVDNTIDLALFGRMLAEVPVGGRIDGAAGVAHAFSVDPQAIEPDFYTAV
ncbi:MAG: type I-E CRISPR-associated protein Cas7/Cse4/CasC, partial [Tomitella sp.]|nr:type I-E CRISPR-associated protein Cas7/Cse4/CasC [Tomitella sp.]